MTYLRIILQHWISIFLVGICLAAAAVGLSFIPTQLYSSEVELLIVQQQDNENYVDPYTSQRSAEKLGKNLVSVIGTFDFLNRVIGTGLVSTDLFSASTEERKRQWQNTVEAEMLAETGVLHVTAYGPTMGEAEDIVMGVTQVLTTNASDYHGGGSSVQIKQIDGPVTSDRPVKPNIPINGILAGLFGFVLTSLVHIVREETKRAKQQPMQYQVPIQQLPAADGYITPQAYTMPPVEYKVLDEFPPQPYVYGAELKDQATPEQDDVEDEEEPEGMPK
ncbi:MAG: hypothetical protein ACD_41C00141G0001 [uncultured bacterium]|nr:MAG: hypothetical protein ACD_41C00141G0001 [uncultured bacterium]HBY73088.1 hypothetical protein [Candidatus Kerfeldbacteria bacterium]